MAKHELHVAIDDEILKRARLKAETEIPQKTTMSGLLSDLLTAWVEGELDLEWAEDEK